MLINNQIQQDQFYVTNTEQLETVAAFIHLQHNEQVLLSLRTSHLLLQF